MNKIKHESWEDGERIITINGHPCGQTLSERDAITVQNWLKTALREIVKSVQVEVEK